MRRHDYPIKRGEYFMFHSNTEMIQYHLNELLSSANADHVR